MKGGSATGPSPVDRGKAGSKHHLIVEAHGIPVAAITTGGNRNDVTQLIPLIQGIPPIRGKRGRRLYAMPEPPTKRSRDSRIHLTAFDLATGAPVWGGTPDDDRLDGDSGYRLLVQDGTLTVLTSRRKGPYRVRVLDPATGEQREIRDLPDDADSRDEIFMYQGRLVVARYGGAYSTGSSLFTAYERR